MDFARNLLKKYGWEEGNGLGKNNDGISKPLQPNLKFDTAGLGVDKAVEFKNHWWERVFNDAASNIEVNKSGKGVEIAIRNEDSVEITTNEYSRKKLGKGRTKDGYNFFVKKSVLNGLRENVEGYEESDSDEQLTSYKTLTDEELFAACGGRTAHKGARHGLRLTGKLSRIEEQERELLRKMQGDSTNSIAASDCKTVINKKKRKQEENKIEDNLDIQNILYTNEYHNKSKKKRKKEKNTKLATALSSFGMETITDNEGTIETNVNYITKKNCRKNDSCEPSQEKEHLKNIKIANINPEIKEISIRKKKKKNGKHGEDFLKTDEPRDKQANKKKKNKDKKSMENIAIDIEAPLSLTCSA